ncbi:MAG: endolytic transglycosylase MltG [Balneolales bacterium]
MIPSSKMLRNFTHFSKRELALGLGVFILTFILVFSIRHNRINYSDAVSSETVQVLLLHERTSLSDLPELLDSLEVNYNPEELKWTGKLLNWKSFEEGRYEIREGSSNKEFLKRLAFGMQDPQNVLIPTGTTEDRFIQRVSRQLSFENDELRRAMKDSTVLENLGVEEVNLLGRMLPNTYEIYWTSTPEQFLERMISEFDKAVISQHQELYEKMDKTVDEIVTMASIIEWEANLDEEKPIVSGLYWNRLNENWRLQADPTINFALGERNRLRYSDYKVDHPYNTYRIHGLPPGPITNPSYSSINAALYPEEHDYMYMVASPDGGHVFTRTYSEHRQKSREWTTWLREQYRIRDLREAEEVQKIE